MTLSDGYRPFVRSICHDRNADSFVQQTLERELGDVTRSQNHRSSTGKAAKDFFPPLNGRRAHRRGAPADASFLARARSGQQRSLEHAIEDRSGFRATFFPGVSYLPVNLRFAKDHRVETGGYGEEMRGRFSVVP